MFDGINIINKDYTDKLLKHMFKNRYEELKMWVECNTRYIKYHKDTISLRKLQLYYCLKVYFYDVLEADGIKIVKEYDNDNTVREMEALVHNEIENNMGEVIRKIFNRGSVYDSAHEHNPTYNFIQSSLECILIYKVCLDCILIEKIFNNLLIDGLTINEQKLYIL